MRRCRECKRLRSLKKFKKRGSWYAKTCRECLSKKCRKVELEETPPNVRIRICRSGGYHRVYIRDGDGWVEIFQFIKKEEALQVLCEWFGI